MSAYVLMNPLKKLRKMDKYEACRGYNSFLCRHIGIMSPSSLSSSSSALLHFWFLIDNS